MTAPVAARTTPSAPATTQPLPLSMYYLPDSLFAMRLMGQIPYFARGLRTHEGRVRRFSNPDRYHRTARAARARARAGPLRGWPRPRAVAVDDVARHRCGRHRAVRVPCAARTR